MTNMIISVIPPANLSMYSIVNHVMQTASIMASCGLSCNTPFSSLTPRLGIVLMVIPMVATMMNVMDIKLTICKLHGVVLYLSMI